MSAGEVAEGFLREAKLAGDAPADANVRADIGTDTPLIEAGSRRRGNIARGLSVYSPCWEASVRRLHGNDARCITAKAYLAMVAWYVGDATGAAAQFEEASAEALESEHPPAIANTYTYRAAHEMVRGDFEATTGTAGVLLDVAEKNGLGTMRIGSDVPGLGARPVRRPRRDGAVPNAASHPSTRALGSWRRCFMVGSQNSNPSGCPWTRR